MNIQSRSVVSILMVIAVVAVAMLVLNPLWNKFSEAQAIERLALEKQDKLKSEEAQLEQFITEYNSNSEYVVQTNTALPVKGAAIESVLANLDDMARSSGLTLSDITLSDRVDPDKKVVPNSIQTQEVSFVASGSFPSLKNFLLLSEANLRIIDIKDINFEIDNNGNASYKMRFNTYYQN